MSWPNKPHSRLTPAQVAAELANDTPLTWYQRDPAAYSAWSADEYERRQAALKPFRDRLRARIEHDRKWPLHPEHYGDLYLVEELGYKL